MRIRGMTTRLMAATAMVPLTAMLAPAPAFAQAQTYNLNIPAMDLGDALRAFGRATRQQVVFSGAAVRGRRSNAIDGSYSARDALERMTQGSGLSITVGSGGIFMLRETDSPGSGEAEAGGAAADSGSAEQEIIVTGTNIRGVTNPTTPLIKYSRRDIDLSGSATVEDFLRTIPQNFSVTSSTAQNSANPNDSDRNVTSGTAVDLRGAGAGATLVLLNGRRPMSSGLGTFIDVSSLPLSIIERVDIQTDGASAVYGSDAVAGVVNFITRTDFEGIEASARVSGARGGREQIQARGTAGANWSTGGVSLSSEYTYSEDLAASERSFVDQSIIKSPRVSLFPQERRWSFFGAANQEILDGLRVAGEVIYADRSVQLNEQNGTQVQFLDQESLFATARIGYRLSDRLTAEAFFDYGENQSSQENTRRPGIVTTYENKLRAIEGRISGSLLDLPAGPLSFAAGGLYREETFDTITNPTPGLGRRLHAGYGELLVPLARSASQIPFIDTLHLSLAARYESYNDFGDAFNPKIGLHWAPVRSLALRGTYSTSFRAPNLVDINSAPSLLFLPIPSSFLLVAEPPPQDPRLNSGDILTAYLQGATDALSEERAKVWTVGFDFTPDFVPGLNVSMSYFDIAYTGRVERRSDISVIQQPEFLSFLTINPDPGYIANLFSIVDSTLNLLPFEPVPDDIQMLLDLSFLNVSARTIRGVDAIANYAFTSTIGEFRIGVNINLLLDYKLRITDRAEQLEQVNTIYNPLRFRARTTAAWSRNGWEAFLALNHFGGYENLIGEQIGSWTTVDLALGYDGGRAGGAGGRGVRTSVNIQNLLDQDPPFVRTIDGYNFDTSNASPLGRVVSFTLGFRW